MRFLKYIVICLFFTACDTNDDVVVTGDSLATYLSNKQIETGAVIACAASEEDTNNILTFFYPETGATNIRFYQTETATVDKLDYSKYTIRTIESEPFFNGYLGKFTTQATNEHWIIVTFELDNEVRISNPIRTKQIIKPSVWNDEVSVNQASALMPVFNWEANAVSDNAIYFQVVSTENNDLISGTYTYDNNFQFYNTFNVVLNITEGTPELENNSNYNFTLMDVSLDNWVNLVSQKAFSTL